MESKDKTLVAYISAGVGIMCCMVGIAIFCINPKDTNPSATPQPTSNSGYSTNVVTIDDEDAPSASEPDYTLSPTDNYEPDYTQEPITTDLYITETPSLTSTPIINPIDNNSSNSTVNDVTSSTKIPVINTPTPVNNSTTVNSNDTNKTEADTSTSQAPASSNTSSSTDNNVVYTDSYTKRY